MDSDNENFEALYEEKDARKHDKLVEKILSLHKTQNLKKPSRTEPTLQISEFNLVKSITGDKGSIEIDDLTKPLKDRKSRVKIGENVKKAQRHAKTLPKPLEKPQANRIRRGVAYEKTRLQLDRWDSVVTANRVSNNLSFPLNDDLKMDKEDTENFASMWRVKSDLQKELEKHQPKVEEFHINLEKEKFPLTMKEMLTRRKEAAKLRAFQGYQEAKARRQNKIKSKKFHRVQKRERIKKKLKEFEQLQKTDPEEALKKLEEIEKTRVEERFSLRHKSTGKWARNQQIRAKYDKESRQNLAQQLTLSRDLTQKSNANESSSDEEEQETPVVVDESNPWINGIKPGQEVAEFITGYRKYWMNQNKDEEIQADSTSEGVNREETDQEEVVKDVVHEEKVKEINKAPKKKKRKSSIGNEVEETTSAKDLQNQKVVNGKKKKRQSKATQEWEVSVVDDETRTTENNKKEIIEEKQQRKKISHSASNTTENNNKKETIQEKKQRQKITRDAGNTTEKNKKETAQENHQRKKHTAENNNKKETKEDKQQRKKFSREVKTLKQQLKIDLPPKQDSNIDPEKYMQVKPTNLSIAVPDLVTEENEHGQRAMISEAFEDDDVVAEFTKDKQNEIDKNNPKNVDLSLPGWGSWGGTGVKPNKRKKRRFTFKVPKKIPRRDDNKGFLVVNEKAQDKIKEHKVSEVPFPFKTVKDYEASVRAPIGNTFVPETAYKRLIRPPVRTKMGTIIEPMSKDFLVNKDD